MLRGGWGGQFERTVRFKNKPLSVHTGTIDSCWKQMKTHIRRSLSSKPAEIPVWTRSWQWHISNAQCSDLFRLCGTQLSKLWGRKRQRVKFARRCDQSNITSSGWTAGDHGIIWNSKKKIIGHWGETKKNGKHPRIWLKNTHCEHKNDAIYHTSCLMLTYQIVTPPRSISDPAGLFLLVERTCKGMVCLGCR